MVLLLVHADGIHPCICINAGVSDVEIHAGDLCIAEIDGFVRYCTVQTVLREKQDTIKELEKSKFIRLATEEDKMRRETSLRLAENALKMFDTENAGAPQKPYAISATFDEPRKHLWVLYHADHQFDARRSELSLSRRFGAMVSVRQVGIRDEVAAVGSIGPCGRPVCCARWLSSVNSLNVNVKMAKKQNISLNPSNLNGQCERLKCCLSFENNSD